MPKTLTKAQILDFLIHHVKLQESVPSDFELAHEYGLTKYNQETMPFKTQWYFSTIKIHFISVASTPWKCYSDLARMIWEDFRTHQIVTKLYYNG